MSRIPLLLLLLMLSACGEAPPEATAAAPSRPPPKAIELPPLDSEALTYLGGPLPGEPLCRGVLPPINEAEVRISLTLAARLLAKLDPQQADTPYARWRLQADQHAAQWLYHQPLPPAALAQLQQRANRQQVQSNELDKLARHIQRQRAVGAGPGDVSWRVLLAVNNRLPASLQRPPAWQQLLASSNDWEPQPASLRQNGRAFWYYRLTRFGGDPQQPLASAEQQLQQLGQRLDQLLLASGDSRSWRAYLAAGQAASLQLAPQLLGDTPDYLATVCHSPPLAPTLSRNWQLLLAAVQQQRSHLNRAELWLDSADREAWWQALALALAEQLSLRDQSNSRQQALAVTPLLLLYQAAAVGDIAYHSGQWPLDQLEGFIASYGGIDMNSASWLVDSIRRTPGWYAGISGRAASLSSQWHKGELDLLLQQQILPRWPGALAPAKVAQQAALEQVNTAEQPQLEQGEQRQHGTESGERPGMAGTGDAGQVHPK